MLRPFAFITRQGSRVRGDILPGVGFVASGHSLTFPKKRAHKMKVSPDECSTGHWAKNVSEFLYMTLCSQNLGG